MQKTGWALLLALGLSGCTLFKAEGPSAHPLEFIRKDADTVVEFRDIALLVDYRTRLSAQLKPVLSSLDVEQLIAELSLVVGFDPTTKDGLKSVGVATSGPVAGEVLANGSGAVWAIPVTDAKAFGPVLESTIKARRNVDAVETEDRNGVKLKKLTVEFGPRQATVAAYAAARGHIVVGFGSKADDLVVSAVRLERTGSLKNDGQYRAFISKLGDAYDVRVASPKGGQAMAAAARRVTGRPTRELGELLDRVTRAGWAFRYEGQAFKYVGRADLDERGRSMAGSVFALQGKAPAGVLAVDMDDSVIFAQMGGDPRALLDIVAPEGSEPRKQLQSGVQTVKSDLDIDLLGDILPNFSGHAALAVGINDLSKVDFRALIGSPEGQAWLAFAASAKDPEALQAAERKLEGRLAERSVKVKSRKVGKATVRDIVPLDAATGDSYFATFALDNVWGFSADPARVDRLLSHRANDTLGGSPGMHVELRFARLAAAFRRFNSAELPILYRSIYFKVLAYLDLFDALAMRVQPVDGGLGFEGELRFAQPSASAK